MRSHVLLTALLKHLHELNHSRKELLAMEQSGNLTPFMKTITNTELVSQIETCQCMITEIETMAATINPIKKLFL